MLPQQIDHRSSFSGNKQYGQRHRFARAEINAVAHLVGLGFGSPEALATVAHKPWALAVFAPFFIAAITILPRTPGHFT
jgi:hypothetical protein